MRYLSNLFFAVIYCAIGVWIGWTHAMNPARANAVQSPAANAVSSDPTKPGFTIPAEMMPQGDTYFVTIIKGHGENEGIWVLDRPLTTATEKAGFVLIMEAAKKGDAKRYPLPDQPKSDEKKK